MHKLQLKRRDILKQIEAGTLSSIEGLKLIQQISTAPTTSSVDQRVSVLEFFGTEWVKSALPVAESSRNMGHLLVFDDDETICRQLRTQLTSNRIAMSGVVFVRPGRAFRKLQADSYEVDPTNPDDYRHLFQELQIAGSLPANILYLWTRRSTAFVPTDIPRELDLGMFSVFLCTKALLELKRRDQINLFYLYHGSEHNVQPQHFAVSSFGQSLRQEYPNLSLRTIALDAVAKSDCVAILLREFCVNDSSEIAYRGNERTVRRLRSESTPVPAQKPYLRENGVYLLTGGAGGLGKKLAEHLVREQTVKLVIAGRSSLNAEQTAWLKQLNSRGAQVIYLQADVSEREDVEHLLNEVRKRFNSINGVIHGAGIIRDAFLHRKSLADLTAVLRPKVNGAVWLDEFTRNDRLDFFVLFSSVAAIFGSVGQCDYAYANGFLDGFARWRESLRAKRERHGRTLSINWPLWQDGGMAIDERTLRVLAEAGIEPLTTEAGLSAFDNAFRSDSFQQVVLFGKPESLRRLTNINAVSVSDTPKQPSTIAGEDKTELLETTEAFLKQTLAREAKLPLSKIRPHEPLENLGIDSLLIMTLTRELEKIFGELPKTLFFEYQTLAELAEYFVDRHAASIQKLTSKGKSDPEKARTYSSTKRSSVNVKTENAPQTRENTRDATVKVDIAIVGLSGRYPMADDLAEFWENLKTGKDCIAEVPVERWDHRQYFDTNKKKIGKSYSKWGGFINDVDKFDPLFFNISPAEAELIDPQERLFLETVWQTIEDAGYTRQQLSASKTGVFVGVMYGQYQLFSAENAVAGDGLVFGSSYASIANRASYFFNFKGPSIALDTMCSSSLTAIHLACTSIWQGECNLAIAGGVNLSVHPQKYQLLSQGRFAASDGRCRSFGDGGDGYVPGEGVGAILLKPLALAIADRDHIHGVIKGSSINHGGKTNGYTVPNPKAQAELISEALKNANLEPWRISYVEAHGTGTSLGDPIEIAGLTKAFQSDSSEGTKLLSRRRCPIGSVKSNIGHLESAAGIAAVSKVLLQFKHQKLVPSLHSKHLNPNLNLHESPFFVQQELSEWKQPKAIEDGIEKVYPRQAGVSGFGAGGSNAHLILEEYRDDFFAVEADESQTQIVVLSAKTHDSLKRYAAKLLDFLTGTHREQVQSRAENTEVLFAEILQDLVKRSANLVQVTEPEIDPADSLREVGFDWMGFTTLAEQLSETYQCEVHPSLFSASTSVADLARHIATRSAGKLETVKVNNSLEASAIENFVSLADLAFTLQVGREPMNQRLAIVTSNKRDLCEKLRSYCDDNDDEEHVYQAALTADSTTPERLVEGRTGEKFVKLLIEDREWDKLAQLWVSGVEINWSLLHEADGPSSLRRVSLPTYQFARERYWAPAPPKQAGRLSRLHPLIDRNTSGLRETRFTTHLEQENSYLTKRQGEKYFPSLAIVEMVRAAGEIAEPRVVKALQDIAWGSPIVVNAPLDLQVSLHPGRTKVRFQVSSSSEPGELVAHSQGMVIYENGVSTETTFEILDLEAIKARCRELTSQPDLLVGSEEALARFVLSDDDARNETRFFIHPALLEGVLQSTSIWLSPNSDAAVSSAIPLTLEEVEFKQPLTNVVFAYLRTIDNNAAAVSSETVLNVDLADEWGRVLVRMSGLALALAKGRKLSAPVAKQALPISANSSSLRQQLERDVQAFAAELIKIAPEQLELTAGLGDFGFESVTFVELGEKLNQHLNIEISPTIFFERDTVRSLAEYLLEEFSEQVKARYAKIATSETAASVVEIVSETPTLVPFSRNSEFAGQNGEPQLDESREAIAIVGMSGVFPGSRDLNHFWENLKAQKDLITEIPAERWDWREFHKDFSSGQFKTQVKWGGFIEDADKFDARFFSISPFEAEMMDPQQRLFLETVWTTIEDAGYRASEFAGRRVGLFVGVQFSDYQQMLASQGLLNAQMGLGNEHSILVNRISYLLNLRGPSEPYNTACSSSLVAVHRAVNSIRSGESELAIAGGISLMLSPYTTISGDSLGVLSLDGRCKTLDASANGYVRGEGVGALLLKPLSRAQRDNDHIYAVIKGTAVNHGGKAPSLTAPNSEAQAALLIQAYEEADVDPESVSYLELHGTGTKLGDPIEIEGIKRAFKQLGERRKKPVQRTGYCGIGSVKTNIGHLEPASGIAGLAKLVLSMQHRTLPGIVHLNELNPYVKLEQTPFYIVDQTRPWDSLLSEGQPLPRRAGVSSFGFGGVNAHVVLEEYESPARASTDIPQLFVLSAKTEERLREYGEKFLRFLTDTRDDSNVSLADVAYTLQIGREEYAERLAIVAKSLEELRDKLVLYLGGQSAREIFRGKVKGKQIDEVSESDKKLVSALIENNELHRLAARWIAGTNIDWPGLHVDRDRQRVPLPTYPFARTRYWALQEGAPVVPLIAAAKSEEPNITLVTDSADAEPGNDPVLHEIRNMFAEELKTDISSLELDTDFTEFGVDSILASVIVQRIRERYGDTITLSAIVEHPTLRELTAYVRREGLQEQVAQAPQPTPFAKPGRPVSQFPAELVPLNLKGTQQTSFWVHGGVGYAALYANLSRSLGPDYPFYAFQARGVDGKSIPHDFEEMIAHYTHCIRLAQAKGPYVIGGYSYGGLVAYEIARRMHLDGDKISRLVLFDTLPSVEEAFKIFLAQYGADDNFLTMMMGNEFAGAKKAGRPLITMKDIENVPEKLRLGHVSKLAKERGQTAMSADEIYNYIRGSIKLCDYTEATYRSYRAEPYEGSDVLYFKAQKFLSIENWIGTEAHDIFRHYDYIEPWRQLVRGDVSVVHLPCDHFNMLEEPALSTSVEHVRACLNGNLEQGRQTRVA